MEQSERTQNQSELDEIDREWELEKIQYSVGGCGRCRDVPGKLSITVGSLIIIAFGLLMLTSITSSKPAVQGA